MNTLEICPQHIFEFTAKETLRQKVQTLIEAEQYEVNHVNWVTVHKNLAEKPEYKELTEWFKCCVEQVRQIYEYKCDGLKISQMWANKSESDNWHHIHNHPFSIISAIFYVTDSPAETWFSVENFWVANYGKHPLPLTEDFTKCPHIIHKQQSVKGKLILFPSHLLHSVSEHKGEKPRYTISFNTFPTGIVGDLNKLGGVVLPR